MRSSVSALLLLFILTVPIPVGLIGHDGATLGAQESVAIPSEDSFFIRGPTVHMVTNHSALIYWRTEDPTNAEVHYGLNASVLESESNSTLDTHHKIWLENLLIDSKYYYQVESDGTLSDMYHFRTAPADGGEFKMIIIGDNRPTSVSTEQPEEYEQIVDLVIAEEPHLILHSGDFVLDVTADHEDNLASWAVFNNITDRMGHYAPIYAALGNHDTGTKTGQRRLQYYFDAFEQYGEPQTYYSFDYAGVHFTAIDTEEFGYEGRIVGDQLTWLVNDIESSTAAMKFVIGHRPMYPLNHIGNSLDSVPAERLALQNLFEANNVTGYICGHDHLYNRMTVNGVVHLISGGAGAPLYWTPWGGNFHHYAEVNVSSSEVSFAAIGLSGETRDTYQLPYEGPIEIFLRVMGNETTKMIGTMPEVYFSEVPAEYYYSWDSGANQTELTGLPSTNGQHTLDVYARNDESVWSSAHYVFTAVGEPTSSTTGTTTGSGIDPLVLFSGVAVAGVAVVVVLIVWVRKRG